MRLKVLPYVTVEVDDRLRRRVRAATDRLFPASESKPADRPSTV